jgi:hypothetical protein
MGKAFEHKAVMRVLATPVTRLRRAPDPASGRGKTNSIFKLNPSPEIKTRYSIEEYSKGNASYLAMYLRSGDPVTPEIREFLATILEGKVKRKRGPKTKTTLGASIEKLVLDSEIKQWYEVAKLTYEYVGKKDIHGEAVAWVAKKLNISDSESRVDRTIYPRNRTLSRTFPKK